MPMNVPSLWEIQSTESKALVACGAVVVVISIIRFTRLAWAIYGRAGEPVLDTQIADGTVDPERLARAGLAGRLPHKKSDEETVSERGLAGLRMARSAFAYFWETCLADVASTRRAAIILALLCLSAVAVNTSYIFRTLHYSLHVDEIDAAYDTIFLQMRALCIGMSVTALVLMGSTSSERKLVHRKADWEYACDRLSTGGGR